MSLLDDLRAAFQTVDHQFLPTAAEMPGVVGAIALYLEHGEKFLETAKSAGVEGVTNLITEAEKVKSDQQAAQAAQAATAQQTQVIHEPGVDPTAPPAPVPAPAAAPAASADPAAAPPPAAPDPTTAPPAPPAS